MVKHFFCAVCLLLLCAVASASVGISMEDSAMLLSNDGEIIVPEGKYAEIVSIGNGLFAVGDSDGYALMNAQGEVLSKSDYDFIKCDGDAIIAEKDGSLGLLSTAGQEISEFKYTFITADESGICWALYGKAGSALGMRLCILSKNGEESETELYLASIGDAAFRGLLSAKDMNGRYGYIDFSGEMAIEAQFQYASDFLNGCAVVVIENQYAAIDANANVIIPPKYDFLQISEYGYIVAAQSNARVAIFDLNGELIDEYFGDDIGIALVGSYYIVRDDVSLRIYSDTHEMLAELSPTSSVYAGIGTDLIIADGVFGAENTHIWNTESDYQQIYPLCEIDGEAVYAAMIVNAVKYENHTLGEIQYSLDMRSVRYALIGSDGEALSNQEYLSVEYLGEERLFVQTEEAYQMIGIDGRIYWSKPILTEASDE